MPENGGTSLADSSARTQCAERAVHRAFDRLAAVLMEIAVDAAARESKKSSGRDSPSVVAHENLD